MRYLDGEMSPVERTALEARMQESTELARELGIYQSMREGFADLSFSVPSRRGSVWDQVHRQLYRPLGWILVIAGLVVWVGFGVYAFVTSPGEVWEKAATSALVIGLLVLLSSVILERYKDWLTDPYRDVQR